MINREPAEQLGKPGILLASLALPEVKREMRVRRLQEATQESANEM